MPFDFKKEYKELYLPKEEPGLIEVPPIRFLALRGKGDPNEENGEYAKALPLLYGTAYTLRMSYKGTRVIEGYFPYVVPPLEGVWWQEGIRGFDPSRKDLFSWIVMLRLPDFFSEEDVLWAKETLQKKKRLDASAVEVLTMTDRLCVQILHVGPYEEEIHSVEKMESFARKHGYVQDFSDERMHREIYLSDPRKTAPEKLKTVLRHPVKKKDV